MKTMSEVLSGHRVSSVRVGSHAGIPHMPDIGVYEQRCQTCGPIKETQSAHQAAALTAAGFGPVREAGAQALRDAADALDELWNLRKIRMGECRDWADGVEESETLIRARAATVEGGT